ncbi:MAG: MarR family transcriptional regulator [Hyphomonadaceae bacterium]|nr:MarR family transcriptional regulator [Hyphomonadaceae bacterium]
MPVNPKPTPRQTPARPAEPVGLEGRLYLREDELDRAAELVFRAARTFWRAAEGPLAEQDLGPAHYRALAAIRREEGLAVKTLQARLGVRKQSLQRVLNELEVAGMLARQPGVRDKRERLVTLTDAGREAERAASAALRERLGQVFRLTGAEAVAGARVVLAALAETGEDGA